MKSRGMTIKLSTCNERIKMLKENIGKAEKTDIEKLKADKEENRKFVGGK